MSTCQGIRGRGTGSIAEANNTQAPQHRKKPAGGTSEEGEVASSGNPWGTCELQALSWMKTAQGEGEA